MLLYNKTPCHRNASLGLSSTRAVVSVTYLSLTRSCSLSCSFCVFQGVVMNTKCLDVCLCVLALVFFVCIWPWHEGAGRFGQRGAGWCQLASGHAVQSHQIAITGRFWLDSDALTLSLLSLTPPIPHLSLITPASLSASVCLDVDLCTDNALEPIHHSF